MEKLYCSNVSAEITELWIVNFQAQDVSHMFRSFVDYLARVVYLGDKDLNLIVTQMDRMAVMVTTPTDCGLPEGVNSLHWCVS